MTRFMIAVLTVAALVSGFRQFEQGKELERLAYLNGRLSASVEDLSSELRRARAESAKGVEEAKGAGRAALEACSELEMRTAATEEGLRRQAEASRKADEAAGKDLEAVSMALQSKFGPEKWFYLINEAKLQAVAEARWREAAAARELAVKAVAVPRGAAEAEEGATCGPAKANDPTRSRWAFR